MKAWHVQDLPEYIYHGIVFAETRGEAAYYCVCNEDVVGEIDYIHVRVRRAKEFDNCYRGKPYMDWNDDTDRIDMVKLGGFHCDPDGIDFADCEYCIAKHECEFYFEQHEDAG